MIVAILQARVSSSRLPGKVIKPLLGKPMLIRQIERLRWSKYIDKLVVATSIQPEDDVIGKLCEKNGVECFRGSLNDVLDRLYQAAKVYTPDHVVRLTGDCPLADSGIIDRLIEFHLTGGYDYSSNALESTYPDGLDAEIMNFATLERAWCEARNKASREHVTLYIYSNPKHFKIGIEKNSVDLSHLRWTVDEPEDFSLVEFIYQHLYPENPMFTMQNILDLMEAYPQLKTLNKAFRRNEGLEKSLL